MSWIVIPGIATLVAVIIILSVTLSSDRRDRRLVSRASAMHESDDGRSFLGSLAEQHGNANGDSLDEVNRERVAYIVAFLDYKYSYDSSAESYGNGTAEEYLVDLWDHVGWIYRKYDRDDPDIRYTHIKFSPDVRGALNSELAKFRSLQGKREKRDDLFPYMTHQALEDALDESGTGWRWPVQR